MELTNELLLQVSNFYFSLFHLTIEIGVLVFQPAKLFLDLVNQRLELFHILLRFFSLDMLRLVCVLQLFMLVAQFLELLDEVTQLLEVLFLVQALALGICCVGYLPLVDLFQQCHALVLMLLNLAIAFVGLVAPTRACVHLYWDEYLSLASGVLSNDALLELSLCHTLFINKAMKESVVKGRVQRPFDRATQ